MDLKIRGKVALVMGASAGLGRAIAEALIAEGVRVAICARREDILKKTAEEIGASFALPCDLSRAGAARELVDAVVAKLGSIDILVSNTGGPPKGKFDEITQAQWMEGFQGLWMSAVDGIQAALPVMKKNGFGRILLITSSSAREPLPALTISNGLRAGLSGLAKSLSTEVAAYGITVNALLPGYTRTERLKALGIAEDKITQNIPAGRLGEPAELASLATYLSSHSAAYITGQSIACDGGALKSI